MLTTGKQDDATTWIESRTHTLGEYSHAKSRNIVNKLMRVGAIRVHVCDIDSYDDDRENTGHLVVEIPDESKARKSLFREIARLASLQGFDGDLDNGQRYSYVKLD
jgi:Fe-S-cluster formation regulator IscX/YfhJ